LTIENRTHDMLSRYQFVSDVTQQTIDVG